MAGLRGQGEGRDGDIGLQCSRQRGFGFRGLHTTYRRLGKGADGAEAGRVGKEGRRMVARAPESHCELLGLTVGKMCSPGTTGFEQGSDMSRFIFDAFWGLLRMDSKGARKEAGRAGRM